MNEYEMQKNKVSELKKQLEKEIHKLKTMETCNTLNIKNGDYCVINDHVVMFVCRVDGDTIYGKSYDMDCGYDMDDYYSMRNSISKITKQEAIAIINIWHNRIFECMGLL